MLMTYSKSLVASPLDPKPFCPIMACYDHDSHASSNKDELNIGFNWFKKHFLKERLGE